MVGVADLNPRAWGLTYELKVISKGEARDVNLRGEEHRVCDFVVGDDTGIIELSVWDDDIEDLKVGEVYEFTELKANVYNKSMSLNMTRKSKFKKVDKSIEVNKSVNVSEKEVKKPKRRH